MRYIELAPKIGHYAVPNSVQEPSFQDNFIRDNEKLFHSSTLVDETKNTNTIVDNYLETIRRISEANRLTDEFMQNSTRGSSFNEITKLFLFQTASNLFQGSRSSRTMSKRQEILPTGYQISLCDTCLSGCKLRPVLYPIEIESLAKLVHECDPNNLFMGEEILEKKRQIDVLLKDYLSKVISNRIGQNDAYLKAMELAQHAFSKETREKWKLIIRRPLIEEKDCIKFNPPSDLENKDHWFYRIIRECDNDNKVKITRSDLAEFLRIAKSTFGIFQVGTRDPAKKQYLLIYLVL
jgi:hypothetical protein